MSILVLADIHLKFNDKREKYVVDFFEHIAVNFKKIIILGDFFEFWYGFNNVIISDYFNILEKFRCLKEKKIEITYIEGNHDFNMGKFFTDFLNVNVVTEYYETIINNRKFLFLHGDTINIKQDKFYFYLRKFLRTKFTKFLMNNIPPHIILSIAQYFSKTSRDYLFKDFNMRNIIDHFPKKDNYDFIITGHFHKTYNYKNVYVLGDWNTEFNYMIIDDSGEIHYEIFEPTP
jgi:UDP-2,3-diacylglucosamine hydrolase